MEEVYDISQHDYFAVIFISSDDTYIQIYDTLEPSLQRVKLIAEIRHNSNIKYNIQKTEIISVGNTMLETNQDDKMIEINNFMEELYQEFKKPGGNEFLIKAISDFLSLSVKRLMETNEMMNNVSLDSLFYTFVVPSEWEEEIRNDLIRPIFYQANLISKEDHKDRLLFLTDIEAICYYSHSDWFKRNQNTIMNRCNRINSDTIHIKLDFISTANLIYNTIDAKFFPKIVQSSSFYIYSQDVKNCIKSFLIDKLFPNYQGDNEEIIEEITEEIFSDKDGYNIYDYDRLLNHYYDLNQPILSDTSKWRLNQLQKKNLESICPSDICILLTQTYFESWKNILTNRNVKKYEKLIVFDEYSYSERLKNNTLIKWVLYVFLYNCQISTDITFLSDIFRISTFRSGDILAGGIIFSLETIQNSNLYCSPRIKSDEQKISSSIFKDSNVDTIIDIDISFKSTILSYAFFKEDESIKDIFEHKYFIIDTHLPSLEQFYDFQNLTTVTLKDEFCALCENYLSSDMDPFSIYEFFLSKVEEKYTSKENRSNAKAKPQTSHNAFKKYSKVMTKGFFMMYVIYIKEVISKLLAKNKERCGIKIGYNFSIEKIILDNIFGSKQGLEEAIYESNLLEKDDDNKKLRIITQGEGILTAIQQSFNLKFSLKSYFVLAQLHEDYIQLTLNQVVTRPSLEYSQQEAIILEDRYISISNIHDSLALSMWTNIVQDRSLIQTCHFHNKGKTFDLLNLETKNEFTSKFKKYISEKILTANIELNYFSKSIFYLNHSCDCKISLTLKDIIEISFKPLLENLSLIILSSLLSKDMFGNYTDIIYHFSLMRFNHNVQFQEIISSMLEDNANEFNPQQGIETLCMTIPKLYNQLSESLLPFLYKGFQKGTLYQVYGRNFGFRERDFDGYLGQVILFAKEYDKMNHFNIYHRIYEQKPREDYYHLDIVMDINHNNNLIPEPKSDWHSYNAFYLDDCYREYFFEDDIPLIITITSLAYSSSLHFSTRPVGESIDRTFVFEIGNPMTLYRL